MAAQVQTACSISAWVSPLGCPWECPALQTWQQWRHAWPYLQHCEGVEETYFGTEAVPGGEVILGKEAGLGEEAGPGVQSGGQCL